MRFMGKPNTFLGVFLGVIFGYTAIAQTKEPPRPIIKTTSFRADTVNVKDFGAVGDGQFLNSEAINKAIITINQRGGGVVLVPAGLWLTGPIEMKSNVNLHVSREAILLFSNKFDDYKIVESNWEGQPAWRNQNPISGKNLENIAITGKGIIDGNGGVWRMVKRNKMTDSQWKNLVASGGVVDEKTKIWYPSEGSLRGALENRAGIKKPGLTKEDFLDVKDYLRPNLLVFTQCKRILIEGVTIQNSAAWNLHPLMCEDLILRDILVRNPWYAQNGDGVDIESCKNVLVEDCTFDVGDDGICIKSGRDKAGRDRAMPTENVIIRRSVVYHAHGGFVIGSEMSGGARNIWVEDCSFIGTDIGLRFKTKRGRGGVVENIFINNINMVGIPGEGILFDMYYEAVDPIILLGDKKEEIKVVKLPVTEETPQFKNFTIKNVHINGADQGIFLRGLPEMHVKNVSFENINIEADKGVEIISSTNISLKNIRVNAKNTNPLVVVENSEKIAFDGLQPMGPVDLLMRVSGSETKDIRAIRTDLKGVKKKSEFVYGATAKALNM
ncbi:glycoside hydrolase family 28 protein [Sphingobacterium sp. WQ 366]|uniref:Glycoside hydrolase family 28 protein n=2 Tax=Sphingobacterium bovistauri TaxID=2781959 RepID=A0ABS7Z1Z3_9SPHI|nr:glycoside hydrolase family 28 protein [Sphingobacterium bovistauri]